MPLADNQLRVIPEFFPRASTMRAVFDARFASPRLQDRQRFIWDYWHVPDQYTYVRTFAKWMFPNELMSAFQQHLRAWGQHHLGCNVVTEPWLSFYVDGCGQELHTDLLQGPWAFVYSLTQWRGRQFSGGETTLADSLLLNYWQAEGHRQPLEYNSMMHLQPPLFNQLTVFDARIPHGVRTVEGTRSPTQSRIVLHGWFKSPTLIVAGDVARAAGEAMATAAECDWQVIRRRFNDLTGWLILRRTFAGKQGVDAVEVLTNTLVSTTLRRGSVDLAVEAMCAAIAALHPPVEGGSVVFPFKADAATAS